MGSIHYIVSAVFGISTFIFIFNWINIAREVKKNEKSLQITENQISDVKRSIKNNENTISEMIRKFEKCENLTKKYL